MNPSFTSFVLGFHGCDRSIAESVLSGRKSLRPSNNDYDWLGTGIYFWEFNPQRAYDFALELHRRPRTGRPKIRHPTVVGAVIDLGFCLNLLDSTYIQLVRESYSKLVDLCAATATPLPQNSLGQDLLLRRLDCAVIRTLHATRSATGNTPFDSVRAAFIEGQPLYQNAGFASKNHIQLCVCNPSCIKGYFRPLDERGRPLRFS